jgi:hypothetical protein
MSSKIQASVKLNAQSIVYDGVEHDSYDADGEPKLLSALETNIRESFDEIDTLRGTIQYWESRRTATDPAERDRLMEAFRIMHGELVGLTARMKGLLDRAGLAPGV